jgi:hypothetical protein
MKKIIAFPLLGFALFATGTPTAFACGGSNCATADGCGGSNCCRKTHQRPRQGRGGPFSGTQ